MSSIDCERLGDRSGTRSEDLPNEGQAFRARWTAYYKLPTGIGIYLACDIGNEPRDTFTAVSGDGYCCDKNAITGPSPEESSASGDSNSQTPGDTLNAAIYLSRNISKFRKSLWRSLSLG